MSKIAGVSTHARARALERLGRDLTAAEWHALVLSVLDGTATLLARPPHRGVEIYRAEVDGHPVHFLWSLDNGQIATVFAPEQGAGSPRVTRHRRDRLKPAMHVKARYVGGEFKKKRTLWRAEA